MFFIEIWDLLAFNIIEKVIKIVLIGWGLIDKGFY